MVAAHMLGSLKTIARELLSGEEFDRRAIRLAHRQKYVGACRRVLVSGESPSVVAKELGVSRQMLYIVLREFYPEKKSPRSGDQSSSRPSRQEALADRLTQSGGKRVSVNLDRERVEKLDALIGCGIGTDYSSAIRALIDLSSIDT
jgi:hypothetical protein